MGLHRRGSETTDRPLERSRVDLVVVVNACGNSTQPEPTWGRSPIRGACMRPHLLDVNSDDASALLEACSKLNGAAAHKHKAYKGGSRLRVKVGANAMQLQAAFSGPSGAPDRAATPYA